MKTRYAITKVDKAWVRVLACANQGRHHHDTPEAAAQMLSSILSNNSADVLRSVYGDTSRMKVLPVECYDHGDAVRTVFGIDPEEGGDDLCDRCNRSGVTICRTDEGGTVCEDCDTEEFNEVLKHRGEK